MIKFSIITACYNSWKYMRKYFESLEKQVYKDFEVILIDDCSTDETYERILDYKYNSNIKITIIRNKTNQGPGNSRNRGIKIAKGEWITFIDSDDSVDIQLLKKVNEIVESNDRAAVPINCIVYDYQIVKDNNTTKASSIYGDYRGGIVKLNDAIALVRNHSIGKFYLTNRIKEKNVLYPELRRNEDVGFVCRAIDACCSDGEKEIGNVYYLKEALYNYVQRSDSLSNNKNLDISDMLCAFNILEKTIGKKYPCELCDKSIPDLLYGCVLMLCKSEKKTREIISYIDSYEQKYPHWFDSKMINRMGKSKKMFLFFIRHRMIFALNVMTKVHSKITG